MQRTGLIVALVIVLIGLRIAGLWAIAHALEEWRPPVDCFGPIVCLNGTCHQACLVSWRCS